MSLAARLASRKAQTSSMWAPLPNYLDLAGKANKCLSLFRTHVEGSVPSSYRVTVLHGCIILGIPSLYIACLNIEGHARLVRNYRLRQDANWNSQAGEIALH